MTGKILPFDGVRWLCSGRKGSRAHAFERDSFVSVCGAITMRPEHWRSALEPACARCKAALKRGRLVRT